jgi:hypothetical protein
MRDGLPANPHHRVRLEPHQEVEQHYVRPFHVRHRGQSQLVHIDNRSVFSDQAVR